MSGQPPLRVLFLCTGNSARSQIAEALLAKQGAGRFVAASAGSHPAPRVNPLAVQVLAEAGVEWAGHRPKGFESVEHEDWDFVITVCDRAKEACPIFPGRPVQAHWGMPDPAEVEGSDERKLQAFRDTFHLVRSRVDLFLALPLEGLERWALEERVRRIGRES